MRKTLVALVLAGITLAANAYPVISSDPYNVELNVWNTDLTQAKAKAKALNRPTLIVMLDTVTCGYSKSFVSKIADTQEWQDFLAENPLILVFAEKTTTPRTAWSSYTAPFRDSSTGNLYYPTVALYRPDGTVADFFVARNALGSSPGFYSRLRNTTDQYPYSGTPPNPTAPGTVGFSQSSVSVSEGAGSVSVTVVRQGGSTGQQTFSFATEQGTAQAGVHFTGTGGSLVWNDGDSTAQTISVPLINDNQWTSPTARSFTLKLARISGTASLGTSSLTVTIQETSTPPVAETAPAFTSPTPAAGATVSAALNTTFALQIAATGSAPIAFTVAGLPAGLSFSAATARISGTPTAAGSSTVTVTATNGKGTATTTFTLRVATQAALRVGTYQGFFCSSDQQTVRGTFKLTATASGSLTAKVMLDGQSLSFSGTWPSGTADTAELSSRSTSERLSLEIDSLGIVTGSLSDAAAFGRRIVTASGSSGFAGYYTALLSPVDVVPNSDDLDNRPGGAGYVTFTVSSQGAVRYAGVLADGTRISGSSALVTFSGAELAELGYTGVDEAQTYALFTLYNALYSQRGVVSGQIWIDGAETASAQDNLVFIAGSEWVYPGLSATFNEDGFAATLDDGFFTEIGAFFVKPANLAETFEGAEFETECGTETVQAAGTSISLPAGNSLGAKLTASTSTGLFSGSFLYSPESGAPFTVRYAGVLVPALGTGGGYYVVTDRTFSGYAVKRSRNVRITP